MSRVRAGVGRSIRDAAGRRDVLRIGMRVPRAQKGWSRDSCFRTAVKPSLAAAGKTFFPLAILLRAESRWFAVRGKPRATHALRPVFHAAPNEYAFRSRTTFSVVVGSAYDHCGVTVDRPATMRKQWD